MNIFVLHREPRIAATMMCDKHVVKMILETAQMMCTIVALQGHETPYRPTHARHPCTLWAAQSIANWNWLVEHGTALCDEYTKRYNKVHKSQHIIEWCAATHIDLPEIPQTPFAQAMPPQYRNECAVTAYRAYYMGEKARFATWKTETPAWF